MQIGELKKYVYDNNKIPFILEQLGCQHIKYHSDKEYYSCSNADGGDNKGAVNVYNNQYLNCVNYTRNIGENADLLTLIRFYKGINFRDSVRYVHKLLGLEIPYSSHTKKNTENKPKADPLSVFKKVLNHKVKQNILEFEILDENAFYDFVPYIHNSWFREGIIKRTIDKFNLAYSYKFKRTVIPLRYWLDGSLLGFNMRSSIENCEEFDIPKYYITHKYPKSINLFGLWENYDEIIKSGYVIVGESEKSVLKRHSRLDSTWVALSGHVISSEQVRILIGLSVDVVIALDNDIDIQEIRHICEKFYGIRNIYYIKDRWGLLGEKDSPADANNKTYEFMFKYRVKYDEIEHGKYLKGLKK